MLLKKIIQCERTCTSRRKCIFNVSKKQVYSSKYQTIIEIEQDQGILLRFKLYITEVQGPDHC